MNQKLIGSHAVAQLVDKEFHSWRCKHCGRYRTQLVELCASRDPDHRLGHEGQRYCVFVPLFKVATYVDLSGPIELDGSGVPVIPMDIDERRWLGHNPYD